MLMSVIMASYRSQNYVEVAPWVERCAEGERGFEILTQENRDPRKLEN